MTRYITQFLAALLFGGATASPADTAPWRIGDIRTMVTNYCPAGTIELRGQVLDWEQADTYAEMKDRSRSSLLFYPVTPETVLFFRNALGDTYGGDGRTRTGLPTIKGPVYANTSDHRPGRLHALACMQAMGVLPPDDAWRAFDPPTFLTQTQLSAAYQGQLYLAPKGVVGCSTSPKSFPADGGVHKVEDQQDFFNIVGTRFGGDGRMMFSAPDLPKVDGRPWCIVVEGAYPHRSG